MAIILFPSARGGYGDYSMMITLAHSINAIGDLPSCIIVVDDQQVKSKLLSRFDLIDVILLTKVEFEKAVSAPGKDRLVPTLLIEGPTYSSGRQLEVHSSVPVLYTAEYGANEEKTLCDTFTLTVARSKKGNQTLALNAGLGVTKGIDFITQMKLKKLIPASGFSTNLATQHYGTMDECGIILRKELFLLGDRLLSDVEKTKIELLNGLSETVNNTLTRKGGISSEHYVKGHSLYFIYTHDLNSFENFLSTLLLIEEKEPHRQVDVVLVGEAEKLLCRELSQILDNKLKDTRFSKRVITSTIVQQEVEEHCINGNNGPTLTVLHCSSVQNTDLVKLIGLSNRVAGATGDQSFSECIALGKLPVYSCLTHKERFYGDFIKTASTLGLQNLVPYLDQTVYYLKESRERAKPLMQSFDLDKIDEEFKILRMYLFNNRNYLQKFIDTIKQVFHEPAEGYRKQCVEAITAEMSSLAERRSPKEDDLLFLGAILSSLHNGFSIAESLASAKRESPNAFATPTWASLFSGKAAIIELIENKMAEENKAAEDCKLSCEGTVHNLFMYTS